MNIKVTKLDKKIDERGWVAEVLRNEALSKKRKEFGQIYMTTANPGFAKGNHYHTRKTEWFCIIKGNAVLKLRDRVTHEEKELLLSDSDLCIVEIPPNITHAIKAADNNEIHVLAYIDEAFNKDDPDTFAEKIL